MTTEETLVPPVEPKRRRGPVILGVTAAILVIAAVAIWFIPAIRIPIFGVSGRDAISACQESVLGKLKSPSTASFTSGQVKESNGAYVVSGEVDAQNGFGAMIRTPYRCPRVFWRADTARWIISQTLLGDDVTKSVFDEINKGLK